ncbi:hypothetical protein [Streptomyces violascens]|uniref:hypothetical protein n=1 Tax=Streptomyces violascens TaxID=67381 RepID=UPI0036578C5F
MHSGDTITLPATIGYEITSLHFTAADGYRLHLALGGSGSYSLDLPISMPTGTVAIPLDKMLPGGRNLTFSLTGKGNAAAQPAQRAAHLPNVTVCGPK